MKTRLTSILLAFTACAVVAHAQAPNLFAAARTNDVNSARILLANKADVNQQDDKGYTPLIMATYNGSYEVAQLLLEHGASTEKKDRSGRTALMGASFKGDERDVALLLQHGADEDAKDAKGLNSMMYAVMFGRISVIRVLRAAETARPTTTQVSSTK